MCDTFLYALKHFEIYTSIRDNPFVLIPLIRKVFRKRKTLLKIENFCSVLFEYFSFDFRSDLKKLIIQLKQVF